MRRIGGLLTPLLLLICSCNRAPENISPHYNSDQIVKIETNLINVKADEFTFAVLGDNRGGDKILTSFIKEINDINPAPLFIIDSGDLVSSGKEYKYKNFLGMIAESKIPFLCLPGNHDYLFDGKKLYAKYFGRPYYYFDLWDFRFIILDNAYGVLDQEQINWLTKLLAERKKCFLFMHVPPPIGKWSVHSFSEGADSLLKLIKKENNILACFFGHIHGYGEAEFNGVKLFVSAGAGAPLYSWSVLKGAIEPVYNYMLINVKKDGKWSYKVIKKKN